MAQSSVCGSVLASQPPGTRRIGSSDQFPEWNGYAPPVDIGRFPVIISSPADRCHILDVLRLVLAFAQ